LNKKIVAVAILALISIAVSVTPEIVFGQTQNLGITIYQVTPSSLTGPVGQAVNVQGTIYTSNGSYNIIFANQVVASGKSEGFYVNANFSIPQIPAGTYALRLQDVAVNSNSTEQDFQVTTAYLINAIPAQIQEGKSVVLNLSVTGGAPSAAYSANVSIVLPGPLSTVYSKIASLGTANSQGTANVQATYPDSSFQPAGSLSDYAGSYDIYFNQSTTLAQGKFTVSFLDSSTYHRGDPATIRATGYQANQAATLSITSGSGSTIDSESLTASADGVISKTWVVPSNAVLGTYNVTITSQGTAKAVQDSTSFSVIGFSVKIKAVNLAGEVVAQIPLQVTDSATNAVYSGTTGLDGVASFSLGTGTQVLNAFFNGVNVGQTNITVTGDSTFNFQLTLTNLKITVENANGVLMPFVNLAITYQYQPSNGGSAQTGTASGQTDTSGSYILNSTLTGVSYTISASLYNQIFNSGNNTFNNISAQPVSTILITCPTETLALSVVGYSGEAISGARIELVELTNGLFYSATTDSSGTVTTQVTFGMYRARVYQGSIPINDTNVSAFSSNQQQIRCTLYGIQVTVSVLDFFGHPMPNINVTLNGPATERLSAITQSDGTAAFNNVIGGILQFVAFAPGAQDTYQAVTLTVNQPTTVQVRLDRYVALGSLLIPVSSLIAILIVIAGIVVFVVVEVLRRRLVHRANET